MTEDDSVNGKSVGRVCISRGERVGEGLGVIALFHDSSWVYPDFFQLKRTLRVFRAQASSSGAVVATETPLTERPQARQR